MPSIPRPIPSAPPPELPPASDGLRLSMRDRLLILGFWCLLGLLETAGAYFTTRFERTPMPLDTALLGNMPWWLVWAVLTPLVFWIARRVALEEGRWGRFAAAHFSMAVLFSAVHILIAGFIFFHGTRGYYIDAYGPIVLERSLFDAYERWAQTYLIVDVIVYWAIVGAYHALAYNQRFRRGRIAAAELEARAAQLEARVTEARLTALRMELNPHFLFNTLNAISGLIRRGETGSAVTMLARLGDLLRVTLERGGEQMVPLEKELEYLERYLEIEQVRFRDRLSVRQDVAPAAQHALVPTLLLQPLVENAVRHGISRRPGAGTIEIGAQRDGDRLALTVSDSGAGFQPGPTREGVGLKNTKARLEQCFGDAASLELGNRPEGGARVVVTMPFVTEREAVEEAATAPTVREHEPAAASG